MTCFQQGLNKIYRNNVTLPNFINNSPITTSDTLISSDEAETPNVLNAETKSADNTLTDAELDRQFIQMQSDLATNIIAESEMQNPIIIQSDIFSDQQALTVDHDLENPII